MLSHRDIIEARYRTHKEINFTQYPSNLLIDRYLSKVIEPNDLRNKVILEIGAGCSSYKTVFLSSGCKKYYANDLILERLVASRDIDPRYFEMPGDFLDVSFPESMDIIFASLTMMFVQPYLQDFIKKINNSLDKGGLFISMDPNYLCPLSAYRRFSDLNSNPARLFNPFSYAESFREQGFEIESLAPFTANYPKIGNNWLLGTNFWLKARKK